MTPVPDETKRELIAFAEKLGEDKYTMDDEFEFIFADLIKTYGDPSAVKAELEQALNEGPDQ